MHFLDKLGRPFAPHAVAADRRLQESGLPLEIFGGALALFLWVASGSVVLAVANGLGEHPARRLAVGLGLVAGNAVMLWRRDGFAAVFRARPRLVLVLAAAELGAAAVDGLIGGAYVAFSLTSVGVAVVVARAGTVWMCVALLEVMYASVILASHSPTSLVEQGHLGDALGKMVGYPVAALLFLGLRGRFKRFVDNIDSKLHDIRGGSHAFTPALGNAMHGAPLALAAGPPIQLTRGERRVVEGLAAGHAAKALAHDWGVSIATVRTHIKNAKRKTGARTLRELATFPSRPDWPGIDDDGR